MRAFYLILIALSLSCANLSAQTVEASKMIGITAIVCDELGLSTDVNKILYQKLRQLTSRDAFGGSSGVFVLTASPVVVDKQVTPTAPQQYIMDVDLSLYVINLVNMSIVSEITVSLKGINKSENKALISAIRNFHTSNPKVRKFMSNSREKIIAYYNTHTPKVMFKADAMAERGEYKEALSLLSSIPDSAPQYLSAIELMNSIYKKQLALESEYLIVKAKAMMVNKEYMEAINIISRVNPDSPKYKEVMTILDDIQKIFDNQIYKQDNKVTAQQTYMENRKTEAQSKEDIASSADSTIDTSEIHSLFAN